jgi:hypothetical protein
MSSATELRKALSAANVDANVADDIISKAIASGEVVNDSVTPEQIDAAMEAITKSLGDVSREEEADEIAKAYEGDDKSKSKSKDDDDEDDDEDEDEEEEGMGKAWALVDVIAKSADDIVREVADEHTKMAKAYGTMASSISILAKAVKEQSDTLAGLRGQLDGVSTALGQPVAPRAQLANVDVIENPAEAGGIAKSHDNLVEKAMEEIKKPETSDSRKRELADAVNILEAGYNPVDVAQRYSL